MKADRNLITAEGVLKIYNQGLPDEVRALEGGTVTIGRGEFTVFKGPSGSGKTTLLSLIGCISRPTAGSIVVGGRDVAKLPERFLTEIRRKTFGFIFQQFNLLRDITVEENVGLPLYPLGLTMAEVRRRVGIQLSRFAIDDKKDRKVRQLSGGEQQRVAIARALVNDPEAVIADEPTAHLDRELSLELIAILDEIIAEGRTVIAATHDPLLFGHAGVGPVVEVSDGRITGSA